MIKVETTGLYHYEVTGAREQEAAAALDRFLEFQSMDYYSPQLFALQDLTEKRCELAARYDVEIRAVVG